MQSLDELRERDCGRVMEGEGRAGAGCRIIIIIDLERERRKGAATRSPPRRPDMTLLLAAAACRASVGNSGEKWTKESVVSLSLSLPPSDDEPPFHDCPGVAEAAAVAGRTTATVAFFLRELPAAMSADRGSGSLLTTNSAPLHNSSVAAPRNDRFAAAAAAARSSRHS